MIKNKPIKSINYIGSLQEHSDIIFPKVGMDGTVMYNIKISNNESISFASDMTIKPDESVVVRVKLTDNKEQPRNFIVYNFDTKEKKNINVNDVMVLLENLGFKKSSKVDYLKTFTKI